MSCIYVVNKETIDLQAAILLMQWDHCIDTKLSDSGKYVTPVDFSETVFKMDFTALLWEKK